MQMSEQAPSAVLALDLGSTNLKAGLFGPALEPLASGAEPVTYEFGPRGRVELPVAPFTSAVTRAIRSCLESVPDVRLGAIAITSQAQTFTLADAAGQAIIPFVSWQDNCASSAAAALAKSAGMDEFPGHSSFAEILPALQIAQLRRLRDEQPARLRAAHRVLHLPTFLVQAFTGKAVIDDNLAAMSGLFSLELNDWWPAARAAAGVSRAQLPEVIPIGHCAGVTTSSAAAFGLPPGVPVVLAGNDQTAGAFSVGIHEEGGLLLTLGTAQVAYAATLHLPPPAPGQIRGPFPGGLAYRMGADSCGGNVINWAQTVIANAANDPAFFALAAQSPAGCHRLIFDAGLPSGTGAWRNLGMHHRPADLARSVLESLCQRMEQMIRQLAVPLPPRSGHILAAGGGSASPLWLEMLTHRLGCAVRRTDCTPLRGAAALGLARPRRNTAK
jgi:xylulokinase